MKRYYFASLLLFSCCYSPTLDALEFASARKAQDPYLDPPSLFMQKLQESFAEAKPHVLPQKEGALLDPRLLPLGRDLGFLSGLDMVYLVQVLPQDLLKGNPQKLAPLLALRFRLLKVRKTVSKPVALRVLLQEAYFFEKEGKDRLVSYEEVELARKVSPVQYSFNHVLGSEISSWLVSKTSFQGEVCPCNEWLISCSLMLLKQALTPRDRLRFAPFYYRQARINGDKGYLLCVKIASEPFLKGHGLVLLDAASRERISLFMKLHSHLTTAQVSLDALPPGQDLVSYLETTKLLPAVSAPDGALPYQVQLAK